MIPDDVSKSINGQKASFGDSFESLIPLQRFGTNADIAPWALFIASPGASWFTGQTIVVDGG
jgi:NAD(P)-dependent dehydrogenase (short-subunit alcohol dehydrogenase family)